MKRILMLAAVAAAVAGPALAQSVQSTTGGPAAPAIPPVETRAPDQMGAAARTGDINAAPVGTDAMSTSSTTGGDAVSTQGLEPNAAATASEDTPSGGIVPGQTPE